MTRTTPVPETVTIHVPFHIVKRGGRKEFQLPENAKQKRAPDNTVIKALARAFRWKQMLESGEFTTIAELAEREGIALSYTTRVLRLTLLAPDIVEAILEGKQGPELTLAQVLEPFAMEWAKQRKGFGSIERNLG
ncbi:hypothetical protein [Paracoccus sp. SCSIO 75233]|uniref:hypothetical protein n=1 Tax=Paracoccus sp. SCSIO 75233 TaxID=3017782 RepID=UPI0022F0517C|nr:hypothetical protein [Paracoccus sp. SCSIO 75233]WBU53989.1 hypothetical protein PAF12_03895 [Paracoccus sp. SCSIO 75233]